MSETALWSLQKALFKRLSQANLGVTGVYDDVPEEIIGEDGKVVPVSFPYITIGDPESTPFVIKNKFVEEIPFVVHVWSNYKGKMEAYEILNKCLESLKSRLPLEDGFFVSRFERSTMTVIDDIDGTIRHGILRLRFYITKRSVPYAN